MAAVGETAAAMGADQTNQMGVGHNNFPPSYSRRGVRAGSGQLGYDGATSAPSDELPHLRRSLARAGHRDCGGPGYGHRSRAGPSSRATRRSWPAVA